MRKTNEDALARTAAERTMSDLIAPSTDGEVDQLAKDMTGWFKTVEFETTSRRVGDEDILLRRLILTGPWEIDLNA